MPHYNEFMHRNNVFRKKPDFKILALEFKELAQYMTIGLRGKLRYNFDDPEALRAFTCALMKREFQKELVLPTNRLIPAIPQRLNYICWLEDLVSLLNLSYTDQITGLDIGTGASCIIPILGAHRNTNWNFLALEIDGESTEFASENVQRNGLSDRIKVVQADSTDQLSDLILSSEKRPLHFLTCNPPFFDQEYEAANTKDDVSDDGMEVCGRPKSKSNTANPKEAVTEGGEIEFLKNLMNQIESCKEDVMIFTSMLGRKRSLQHYKQLLSNNDQISSWSWAELCQGKRIRYAIAWTYVNGLNLDRAPPLRLGKTKKWSFKFPRDKAQEIAVEFERNVEFLKQLVMFDLKIEKVKVVRASWRSFEFILRTQQRPWLNQRRKRREASRANHQQVYCIVPNPSPIGPVSTSEDTAIRAIDDTEDQLSDGESDESDKEEMNSSADNSKNRKRKHSDSCCSSKSLQESVGSTDIERPRTDEGGVYQEVESIKRMRINEPEDLDDNINYLVRCRCTLTRSGHDLYFELRLEHPCRSANDAHDLFQYFKNKLTTSSSTEI